MTEQRVFIAGAGPVGLFAAAKLVGAGIPVTVFEAGEELSRQSRASTFHPPSLDMLSEIGVTDGLIERGLTAPYVQYRNRDEGILGRFDFGEIADLTGHPYRLQCEQWWLTRLIHEKFRDDPNFEICFSSPVKAVALGADHVTVTLGSAGGDTTRTGRWLIGADGASSMVRQSLEIEFDGFTWPEKFLVLTTPHDLEAIVANLDPVTYVSDPVQWNFFLRIPGLWRVMFPTPSGMSDEEALDATYARQLFERILPDGGNVEIEHRTLYRVHQRVATTFRKGRTFLIGDAAHINNPLGGMGMNGGLHDAENLTRRLALVWHGEAPDSELDRFERQRREVTMEHVQSQTIRNKRDLEAATEEDRRAFREAMQERMEDPVKRRDFLMRIGMFNALKRAEELG
ncbi:FAD-dependent oxidoreductase [Amorphus sp. 3PC139-8]|uniref:FAD-dependent oxidoreductase n=1 Tax=Amorphus sp. 3PC139-8 TaxID=2735676 RepID=UPI00345C9454